MFAVLPYTFHWSLGLRVVFIRNECLMSALKSYLSGLNMLVARLWKWLYAEKGPVEYCLSTLLRLAAVFSEGFCVVLVGRKDHGEPKLPPPLLVLRIGPRGRRALLLDMRPVVLLLPLPSAMAADV